jgi:hypothetical protein
MFDRPPRVQFESSPLASLARKLKPRAPAFPSALAPARPRSPVPIGPHEISTTGIGCDPPSRWRGGSRSSRGRGLEFGCGASRWSPPPSKPPVCALLRRRAPDVVKKPNGILPRSRRTTDNGDHGNGVRLESNGRRATIRTFVAALPNADLDYSQLTARESTRDGVCGGAT